MIKSDFIFSFSEDRDVFSSSSSEKNLTSFKISSLASSVSKVMKAHTGIVQSSIMSFPLSHYECAAFFLSHYDGAAFLTSIYFSRLLTSSKCKYLIAYPRFCNNYINSWLLYANWISAMWFISVLSLNRSVPFSMTHLLQCLWMADSFWSNISRYVSSRLSIFLDITFLKAIAGEVLPFLSKMFSCHES